MSNVPDGSFAPGASGPPYDAGWRNTVKPEERQKIIMQVYVLPPAQYWMADGKQGCMSATDKPAQGHRAADSAGGLEFRKAHIHQGAFQGEQRGSRARTYMCRKSILLRVAASSCRFAISTITIR